MFFWIERAGCESLSGWERGRCSFCQLSRPASALLGPALARHLRCNCLFGTQELQVTSGLWGCLVLLAIVTSLHKANKKPCCTSRVTCCGLPSGKQWAVTAWLTHESTPCSSMPFGVIRDGRNHSECALASFPLPYMYTPP